MAGSLGRMDRLVRLVPVEQAESVVPREWPDPRVAQEPVEWQGLRVEQEPVAQPGRVVRVAPPAWVARVAWEDPEAPAEMAEWVDRPDTEGLLAPWVPVVREVRQVRPAPEG